jgi:hypothetical protein
MGLRFYRRVRLFPGVRINLSRSGISTSIGVRGAHVTIGHGKVRETVGIPGTGLSYTETQSTGRAHAEPASETTEEAEEQAVESASLFWLLVALLAIFAYFVWRAVA